MNKKEIQNTLDYCDVAYEELSVGQEQSILITQHGGHIFGPFSDRYPEGLFWIPDSMQDRNRYQELIDKKIWNIGGDRVWIAPEIQFNIRDRNRYRESLDTPKTIDPGCFSMTQEYDTVHLSQELDLESYNTVTGTMHIRFRRSILKALNPLRKLPDYDGLMQNLSYCGYEQILDLSGSSEQDIFAEAWDLLQVRTSGTLYIPMYAPLHGADHYAPAGNHETLAEHGVLLRLTGDSQYKIAYKSAVLTGRFGYLKDSDTDDSYLIIQNYPNNPSSMYSEEPPHPDCAGDTSYSIHIYNDDGKSGGFAEMECNLQTIGKPTGISRSIDRLTTWIFAGPKTQLKAVASVLLGYSFPD